MRLPLLNKTFSVPALPGLPVVMVIGSAHTVADAIIITIKAAERVISRWKLKIWGISWELLVRGFVS
jgi:hypothetical protein